MNLSRNQKTDLFRTMLTIRRFEERVYREFYEGSITGFVHSYIGEEAIAAGVIAHLKKEDRIVSHHRGHGHCIAKGADMRKMMAICWVTSGYMVITIGVNLVLSPGLP